MIVLLLFLILLLLAAPAVFFGLMRGIAASLIIIAIVAFAVWLLPDPPDHFAGSKDQSRVTTVKQ